MMTPLEIAAVDSHEEIVNYSLNVEDMVRVQDKIDILELLGASFLCRTNQFHHYDKAYQYLAGRRRCAEPKLVFLLQLIRYEKELLDQNKPTDRQSTDNEKNSSEDSAILTDTLNPSHCNLCCWPSRRTVNMRK